MDDTNVETPEERGTEQVQEQGAIGYILAWILGIPIPILIIIFLIRGCD